ncbi:ABC transporter permease [Corynebacterium sp. HMSC074C01]|uniref:ABC transporter permease n=1 Tax=Corynebacterium sp. HMSC074C01 TaxID=1739482 RepID=UPI0008A2DBAE|nr:ABC transporter permease [Corynebacterium sp. HMSC074C01]
MESSSATEPARKLMIIDDAGLRPVSFRPPLLNYLKDIWQRRHFIWEEAKGKSSTNNRDMLLGRAWNILNPLLNSAMYGIIFGLLLQTSRGIENFIGYLVIGVIFFGFMRQGLNGGAGLIQSSRGLVSSFNFPRAALAFSLTVRNMLQNVVPAVVAIAFGLAFQYPNVFNLGLFLVIPVFILMHIFACGLSLVVARLTAFVPDLRAILTFVSRAWFYSSGVFFSIDRFITNDTAQKILELNPAFHFLQAVRGLALYGEFPSLLVWSYMTLSSFAMLLFGIVFFWRAEARYSSVR